MDGVPAFPVEELSLAWPGEESLAVVGDTEAGGLWSRSRDFDWGD
jgi:hypothetical protein